MTTQHTPGPWKAVAYPAGKEIGYSTHEIQYGEDGECIAEVVHGEADARLIAAAPELLEACEKTRAHLLDIFGVFGGGQPVNSLFDILNKAIAKATNQTADV